MRAAAALSALSFALALGWSANGTTPREVLDLGTLGGNASIALAVNGAGTVVGTSRVAGDAATHAFVYRNGTMTDLGVLPGTTNSSATAINDAGAVVGRAWADTEGSSVAFEAADGPPSPLPATQGGKRLVTAVGISRAGVVAGTAADRGGAGEQVASVAGGNATLPVQGAAVANAVGPTGDLVGTRVDPSGSSQAFLLRGGRMTTVGGASSVGAAADSSGNVAGWARSGRGGPARAFLYRGGKQLDLGLPAGTESEARALNDRGQVVGDFFDTASGSQRAFLWQDGSAVDLNTLIDPASGWVLQQATGINDAGTIVGVGTHHGAVRAFMLPGPGVVEPPARMSHASALSSETTVRVAAAAAADPALTIVSQNASVVTDAAGADGNLYGVAGLDLLRSADEGRTWTRVYTFPSSANVVDIAALASGTLLASVDVGQMTVWRSADRGVTWKQVLALPTAPDYMRTLTAHSYADGNGYVWVGTYVDRDPGGPNYVYRSSDDGAHWTIVNTTTTHRHIHGVRFDAASGRLYVLFGDSDGDGIWQSSDGGATLSPLCTSYDCIAVDMTFDAAGAYGYFGQDHRWSSRAIVRIDLRTGATTSLLTVPWSSFSAFRVGSTILIGSHRESGDTADTKLYLYASNDGQRFVNVYQAAIAYPSGDEGMRVMSALPNGDFPVIVDGYGTTVVRVAGAPVSPPVNTALPAITGSATQGQTLSGSAGTWTGSPTSFAYQWRRCDAAGGSCTATGGTASTYVLSAADVGATVRVAVTATNGGGSATAVSAPTAVVTAGGGGGGEASFGNATVGTSVDLGGGGYLDISGPYTLAANATMTRLNAYTAGGASASTVRGVVYRDSGGQPASFVAVTAPVTIPAGAAPAWLQLPFPTSVALAPGSYWLGYWYADGNGRHYYVNAAGSERYRAAPYSATANPPSTFGAASSASSSYSMVAVYTTTAPQPPANTVPPVVSGSAVQGQTLTASTGTWTGSPTSFGYEWRRCDAAGGGCATIALASGAAYVPTAADAGSTIRVAVTATNGAGSATAVSAQTDVVTVPGPPVNTAPPAIGGTAVQGQTLTAGTGTWTGSPTSYAYEWRRCDAAGGGCTATGGAASTTYVLGAADVGATMRVAVTASNGAGSATAVSAQTAVVTAGATTGVLGQATVGANLDRGGSGYLDVSGPYGLATAATLTRLSAYMAGETSSSTVRGVVYRDSGGQPGAFVAVTAPVTTAAGALPGWVTLTLPAPVALTPGSYWLGFWYADGNGRHYYVARSGSERYRQAAYSATANPPASFGSASSGPSEYSFTASYSVP